jgi:hypothetical protein
VYERVLHNDIETPSVRGLGLRHVQLLSGTHEVGVAHKRVETTQYLEVQLMELHRAILQHASGLDADGPRGFHGLPCQPGMQAGRQSAPPMRCPILKAVDRVGGRDPLHDRASSE